MILLVLQFSDDKSISGLPTEAGTVESYMAEGERLAAAHCSSCHLFPEPELLDRRTWETQTLPAMGPFLGLFEHDGEEYTVDLTPGLPDGFYPDEALISRQEWQKILDYYLSIAPERLEPAEEEHEIIRDDLFFRAKRPSYRSDANPMASAVRFDPGNQIIYLADATVDRLLIYNIDLEIVGSFEMSAPVSDITFINDHHEPGVREMLITYIGNLEPTDVREGSVVEGWYDPDTGEGDFSTPVIENISRPVETVIVDLDQNGFSDLLISEFGHRRGSLFWLKNHGDVYESEPRILIETPGCLETQITDFTGNGLPDVLALCSQADQAIYLFENLGEGRFDKQTLLQFHVLAGSSSFELHDFNNNGHLDILYTSGDNADYSMTYKPYHGVYIYMNDGNNNFSSEWFYPVNGAYSAKARDFNQNGLLDIAVISFFADYARKPQEGFVFFRNNGSGELSFSPYHPQAASYGRWITMDVADWTGNGVDDIVLANFSRGPTRVLPEIEAILTQSPHLLVLENFSIDDPQ